MNEAQDGTEHDVAPAPIAATPPPVEAAPADAPAEGEAAPETEPAAVPETKAAAAPETEAVKQEIGVTEAVKQETTGAPPPPPPAPDAPLPPGWSSHADPTSGKTYFHNTALNLTQVIL